MSGMPVGRDNSFVMPKRIRTRLPFKLPPAEGPVVTKYVDPSELGIAEDIFEGVVAGWTGLNGRQYQGLSGRMRRRRLNDDETVVDRFPDEPPFGYAEPDLFES